jgi:hypothetical protein
MASAIHLLLPGQGCQILLDATYQNGKKYTKIATKWYYVGMPND